MYTQPPQTPEAPVGTVTPEQKFEDVLQAANRIYQKGVDWVAFYREVLGLEGVIRKTLTSAEEMAQFERSSQFEAVQQMLAELRVKAPVATDGEEKEPTRVITVRLPQSLHESLKSEAHTRHTSMNKLCISKLLQMIEDGMVPTET